MGRMLLIIVVGLSFTVAIIGLSMNRSKKSLTENVVGFHEYTYARNIAHTGVNLMLRKLDRNDTSLVNPLNSGRKVWLVSNVMSGVCSVSIQLANPSFLDTVDLTSKAKYMDTTYSMQLRLQRFPKPFPLINSAVGLSSSPIDFSMDNPSRITGNNYNMDGTRGDAAKDTNGVTTLNAVESLLVVPYSAKITGDPNNLSVNPPDNPALYVNEYISAADYVFSNGNTYNGTYGSTTLPMIGYANGDVKFAGSGKFYGVLVVKGTIHFDGTFDMYGLVIAVGGDDEIDMSADYGTPQILGSILIAGASGSSFKLKGTSDVKYSYSALQMAMYINKLQAYKVMRWYE
ncbi:MAG: hypothetical protein HY033_08050 [Ignavibacteriae bacterium]|nr:hypothetical protein [Ignavibacteria bacterium]MBI3364844.1 hypothetical protein [Ignavibacteriota bacterium]